jgi:hypothetical protein
LRSDNSRFSIVVPEGRAYLIAILSFILDSFIQKLNLERFKNFGWSGFKCFANEELEILDLRTICCVSFEVEIPECSQRVKKN